VSASERRAVGWSKLRFRDLVAEAGAGMVQRPGRAMLTALGTVLGIGSFVAVLGLTSTTQGQISDRFTALVATEVMVVEEGEKTPELTPTVFPDDAERRVQQINGVTTSGFWWSVKRSPALVVKGVPLPGLEGAGSIPVIGTSPGLFGALHTKVRSGRLFDEGHARRGDRVAVLGRGVADRLGVSDVSRLPAVFIDDISFTVIGVVDDVQRQPEMLSAVMVPRPVAESLWGKATSRDEAKMLVETRPGAATVVSEQVAAALRPDAVDRLKVIPPPDPRQLQEQVGSDLNTLFLLLAGLCLIVGAVGIANTTMVAVLERVPEIGLRRALGARRRHIAGQFLGESGVVGLLGGLVGTCLGVVTVVIVSLARDWTPVLPTWTVLSGPALGALVGLLAGAYPAVSAARIEPVAALRR
jgi:putative ABC transport system permease protein